MTIYGYIRVSSNKQTVEHQRYEIKQFAKNNHLVVDKWVDENRPDLKKISKIINHCRFANYSWNLWRLSGKPKREFKNRFAQEFKKYYKSGDLERAYFDEKTWLKLLYIMYPYNIIYPILRTFITILSPVYRVRIRDGYRVHYLFNKLVIKKIKLPSNN